MQELSEIDNLRSRRTELYGIIARAKWNSVTYNHAAKELKQVTKRIDAIRQSEKP